MMFVESENKKSNLFKNKKPFSEYKFKPHSSLFKIEILNSSRNSFFDTDNFFNLKLIKKKLFKVMEKHGFEIKNKIHKDVLDLIVKIYFNEIETKTTAYEMQNSKGQLNLSKVYRYDNLNMVFIKINSNFVGFIDFIKNNSARHIYELCNFPELPFWRFEDVLIQKFGDYFFTNIKFSTQLAITDFCNSDK